MSVHGIEPGPLPNQPSPGRIGQAAVAPGAQASGLRLPPAKLPHLPHKKGPSPPRPTPQRDYLRPAYAERFRCIASACEDTCCKDWGVPIDQATYERYRSVDGLKAHVGTLIVLNTNAPTTSDYARIPMMTNAPCPFLDGERLCSIQKAHGPDMLSTTCATYPRAVTPNAGRVEKALNLSCPEAARLTLLDPDLLGSTGQGRARYDSLLSLAGLPPTAEQARLAIREYVLILLGDRTYPLWQRMYLLGNLSRRLETMSATLNGGKSVAAWAAANPATLARLLADSARSASLGRLRSIMDEIPAQPARQLQLVMELLRLRVAEPPIPARFLECLRDFELGLGIAGAQTEAAILSAYAEGYAGYYLPLMQQHPHLLENLAINYVFKNSYPFGRPSTTAFKQPDAEAEHLALCVHVALTQTLLIGIAGHYRDSFNLTHVVKLVQSLAKTIEHSPRFLTQIANFVDNHHLSNPHGIALLLMPPL